jgi:hypothetical protein
MMYTRPRSPLVWLPLILGGSVLYWTVAFGLGAMSLSYLGGSCQEDLELDVPATAQVSDTEEPIVVHIEEPILVRLQTLSEARAAGVVVEPTADEAQPAEQGTEPVTPSPEPGEDTVGQTAF